MVTRMTQEDEVDDVGDQADDDTAQEGLAADLLEAEPRPPEQRHVPGPRPPGQRRVPSRWQSLVKGCRTAARVKFCEGPRTCTHGSTTPTHLKGCPHNERRLSLVFRTHPDIRIKRIDFRYVMLKFCRKFRARISQKIVVGHFYCDGKKSFQIRRRHHSYWIWKALDTLELIALQRPHPD